MNQLFENKKSSLEKSNQSSKKSLNSASYAFDGLYQLQELANQKSESTIQLKADTSSPVEKLSSFSEMASNNLDSNFQNLYSVAQLNPGETDSEETSKEETSKEETSTEETSTGETPTGETSTAEAAPNQQQLMQTQTWVPEKESDERKKLEEEFSKTTFYYGTTQGEWVVPGAKDVQKFAAMVSDKATKKKLDKYKKLKRKKLNPFKGLTKDEKKEYGELKKHKKIYDEKKKGTRSKTRRVKAKEAWAKALKKVGKNTSLNSPSMADKERKEEIYKEVRKERGLYDPGNRQVGYLNAKNADSLNSRADMMDNYYGNKGEGLAAQRSDIIGEFVHKSMGYKGEYDKEKTGREAWMETYGKTEAGDEVEAHDKTGNIRFKASLPHLNSSNEVDEKRSGEDLKFKSVQENKDQQGLYGSMEISRHIREGVKKFGGRIVFEVGGDVFFESAFVSGKQMGDTNVEMAFLLPYFAGKNSAIVPFGKGEIVLQKGGKDIVPTKSLFLSQWSFLSVKSKLTVEQTQDTKEIHTYGKDGDSVQVDKPNSLFNQFEAGTAQRSVAVDRSDSSREKLMELYGEGLSERKAKAKGMQPIDQAHQVEDGREVNP